MRVFVTSGKAIDRALDFDGEVISVGRATENDIQLEDQFASHNHLRLFKREEKWFIEDLKSRNGTFVNGERVAPGDPIEVSEGLSIVVGMSVLSLGKGFSDRILTAPNLAPSPAPLEEASPRRQVDRKMTAQKNMDLIYKVYGVLTEALGIKEKLSKTLDFIFDLLLRIDRGMIILLDSKTGTLKDVVSKCREGVADLQYSKGVVDWVMRHKEAFMVTDADMGGKKAPDTLKLKNIKCVMAVPLISGSRLNGVLYVDSLSRPYGFRWEDIYLMRALSTPIAVAIENALLGEE